MNAANPWQNPPSNNPIKKPVVSSINNKPSNDCPQSLPVAAGFYGVITKISRQSSQLCFEITAQGISNTAVAAEGLLVFPEQGDTVLCVQIDHALLVTQVLRRSVPAETLVIHSPKPIEWVAPVLRFKALQEMELLSAEKLVLSSRHLICGAIETLVQKARHVVQQAHHYSLTATAVMRLKAKQQLVTAEDDIRMDAKRINMG